MKKERQLKDEIFNLTEGSRATDKVAGFVSRNFVVVMRGIINIHYYYIPINKVEAWDGNVLWLKITENEVKEKIWEIKYLILHNIL